MKRPAPSVLETLIQERKQPETAPPTPEGLRCLACPNNGVMCNRACRSINNAKNVPKRGIER